MRPICISYITDFSALVEAALERELHSLAGRISYRHFSVAVFFNIADTEQYLPSLSSIACFTAASSNSPRNWYTSSNFVQTCGGSAARSPEQITFNASSFCRFFFKMITMSVAVHAPSAISNISIGPIAVFDFRSESIATACPDGLVATNLSSPIHFTFAVCIAISRLRSAGLLPAFLFVIVQAVRWLQSIGRIAGNDRAPSMRGQYNHVRAQHCFAPSAQT